MARILSGISSDQLWRAVAIKAQIEKMQRELEKLLGGSYNGNGLRARSKEYVMSASGKAKVAAAQRKRWAMWRKEHGK